jgi:chemotaxis signal transduction protein
MYLAVPRAIAVQNRFLSGVLIRDDGHQIYRIAIDDLLSDPRITAIASLSSQTDTTSKDATGTPRPSERYLVFQAGRKLAVPLSQVTCILQPPKQVVPITEPTQGFEGYFSRSRTSIPLVDLNSYLGCPVAPSSLSRVLLIGEAQSQLAFRVERVFSIETSFWTLQGWSGEGKQSEALVQLGLGANRSAFPILDLEVIAGRFLTPTTGEAHPF